MASHRNRDLWRRKKCFGTPSSVFRQRTESGGPQGRQLRFWWGATKRRWARLVPNKIFDTGLPNTGQCCCTDPNSSGFTTTNITQHEDPSDTRTEADYQSPTMTKTLLFNVVVTTQITVFPHREMVRCPRWCHEHLTLGNVQRDWMVFKATPQVTSGWAKSWTMLKSRTLHHMFLLLLIT